MKSINSLTFPDLNVWRALATAEHTHHQKARRWWDREEGSIGFSRITQIGFLRLLTTAAAMDGKPLTMVEAWHTYDRFFADPRVTFLVEPSGLDQSFRALTNHSTPSPKVWADAYLLAFARALNASFVTFDQALPTRGVPCIVLT